MTACKIHSEISDLKLIEIVSNANGSTCLSWIWVWKLLDLIEINVFLHSSSKSHFHFQHVQICIFTFSFHKRLIRYIITTSYHWICNVLSFQLLSKQIWFMKEGPKNYLCVTKIKNIKEWRISLWWLVPHVSNSHTWMSLTHVSNSHMWMPPTHMSNSHTWMPPPHVSNSHTWMSPPHVSKSHMWMSPPHVSNSHTWMSPPHVSNSHMWMPLHTWVDLSPTCECPLHPHVNYRVR